MNKYKIQLERVYLLNVLIYIDEIHSSRKFLEINKKCREVGSMLTFGFLLDVFLCNFE